VGLARRHWSTASPIRAIFRAAFEAAGLPLFNPHSFRTTLAQLGESVCQNPEQFKAWSQNLGHEGVLTTFLSHGTAAPRRQGQAEVVAQAVLKAMRGAGFLAARGSPSDGACHRCGGSVDPPSGHTRSYVGSRPASWR